MYTYAFNVYMSALRAYLCMCNRGESCPQATIDELHEKVLQEIQRIFDRYKKAAGQPDAVLEVV